MLFLCQRRSRFQALNIGIRQFFFRSRSYALLQGSATFSHEPNWPTEPLDPSQWAGKLCLCPHSVWDWATRSCVGARQLEPVPASPPLLPAPWLQYGYSFQMVGDWARAGQFYTLCSQESREKCREMAALKMQLPVAWSQWSFPLIGSCTHAATREWGTGEAAAAWAWFPTPQIRCKSQLAGS